MFLLIQAISQILNYYQHFPFYTGAVRPDSVIVENDDDSRSDADDIVNQYENLQVRFHLL